MKQSHKLLSGLFLTHCMSSIDSDSSDSKAELPSAVRAVISSSPISQYAKHRDSPIIQKHIKLLSDLERQRDLVSDLDPARHALDLKIIFKRRELDDLMRVTDWGIEYYRMEISPFRPLLPKFSARINKGPQ